MHTFADFSQVRYKRGGVLLEFEFVYSRISTADKDTLKSFYDAQHGEFATDWNLPFDGTTYTNCQFVGPFAAQCIGPKLWACTLRVRTLTANAGTTTTSAVMYAITQHIPNPGYTAFPGAELSLSPVGLTSEADWVEQGAGWGQRTDTMVFAYDSWDGDVLFGLNTNGGLSGTLSPRDELRIYDAWAIVTLADGTTEVRRPASVSTVINSNGGVDNPSQAIDGSGTTYAAVWRTAYTPVSIGTYLRLSGFAASATPPPTPPPGTPGAGAPTTGLTFPTFHNAVVTQYPYGEDKSRWVVTQSYVPSGSTYTKLWNPTQPLGRFKVHFDVMTSDELALLEAFWFAVAGPVGSFRFTDDAGTSHSYCQFEAESLEISYLSAAHCSVEFTIAAFD